MEIDAIKQLIKDFRLSVPERIAKELCSVQPMYNMPHLDGGMTENELRAAGYKPVCEITKLLWIKENVD